MTEYFSRKDQLKFYFRFFINKIRIITDSESDRLQILIVEIMWVIRGILRLYKYNFSLFIYKDFFKTKNGNFQIHKDLQSAITISPTYEIDDIQEFLSIIDQYVNKKSKVLFIDIGAHVGLYTITVGRKFIKYKDIDIIAFEPNANNFYEDNYSLLLNNIKINNLHNVKVYKVGLGSKNSYKPNKFGFPTKTLDSVLGIGLAKKYDVVFIKIDIEGFEEDALKGSELFIKNSNKVYLILEDCVNENIFKYMKKYFKFYKKISPYNSFWIK